MAARLAAQRERSRGFLDEQRSRLDALDQELLAELTALGQQTEEWVAFQQDVVQAQESLQAELAELERRNAEMASHDEQLSHREQRVQQLRHRLGERVQRHRRRLVASRQQARDEINAEVTRLQQTISELEQHTANAHQEKVQLEERVAEIDREKEALVANEQQHVELRSRLEAELNTTRGSLVEQRTAEKELRQQLARSRTLLNERAQQINDLRQELGEAIQKQAEQATTDSAIDVQEFMELRQERDQLQEQVADLRQSLKRFEEQGGDPSEYESLSRRYEMLVEKVRGLKDRNAELENELKSWRGGTATPAAGGFDWEKQKQIMLGEWTGDAPAASPQNPAPTDPLSDNAGHPDLQGERETLRQLQTEWQDKLRAAEVEISIERAENARIRSQLQEKMRDVEQKLKQIEKQNEIETGQGKKSRRRWMDRLGLSGDDE